MKLIPTLLVIFATGLSAFAQPVGPVGKNTPPTIDQIEVKKEALPGGTRLWGKLICKFTTSSAWTDGITFNFTVFLKPAGGDARSLRMATSGATYINVPAGQNSAIMYLSPATVARFGEPVAIKVECFRGDRVVGELWQPASAAKDPEFSGTDIPEYNGMLLKMRSTPWAIIDFEKSPDSTE